MELVRPLADLGPAAFDAQEGASPERPPECDDTTHGVAVGGQYEGRRPPYQWGAARRQQRVNVGSLHIPTGHVPPSWSSGSAGKLEQALADVGYRDGNGKLGCRRLEVRFFDDSG